MARSAVGAFSCLFRASAAAFRTIGRCHASLRSTGSSSGCTGRIIRRLIFHAQYGEDGAQVELGSWTVINGSLPPRALRLVRERAELHEGELRDNWERAQALEPLVPIDPLP